MSRPAPDPGSARRRQQTLLAGFGLLAVGLLVAFLIAQSDKQARPSTSAAAATPTKPHRPGTCEYRPSGRPAARQVPLPPTSRVETKRPYTVTLTTNLGNIQFDLHTAQAPCTANSFRSLAHFRFFDNSPCHRLTTQAIYLLQCGDPTGTGVGGPGYVFADENLTNATYPRGTVAMASDAANRNGAQFFIVFRNTQFDPNYTPFGTITRGLDIIARVAAAGSVPAGDGKPKLDIKILAIRIEPTSG